MKNSVLILFSTLILFPLTTFAQQGWYSQTTCEICATRAVFFLDEFNGWAASRQKILHTTDGGNNWAIQFETTSDINLRDICFSDSLHGWCLDEYNLLGSTSDGGLNWEWNDHPAIGSYVYSIQFIDSLKGWVAADLGIYRTTDGGDTWNRQDSTSYLYKVHFIDSSKGWVIGRNGKIFYSSDGGINWNRQDSLLTTAILNSVFFVDSLKGWAVGDSGIIIHTTDGGQNWNMQNSGKDTMLNDLFFVNSNKGWVVGYTGIILYTSDGGGNWVQQNSAVIWDLFTVFFVDSTTGWVCGSRGWPDTILHTTNGGMFAKEDNNNNNYLPRCSPNPFTGNSTIEYSVKEPSNVKIGVYDNFGREIDVLVNEFKDIGEYKKVLEAKGFTSGVYFLRLIIGIQVFTEKIMLIR